MITEERLESLEREWNECDTWDQEDFDDWWYGLTDEEQEQIRLWDQQYCKGVAALCKDILKGESGE